jgi:hypothetical protein
MIQKKGQRDIAMHIQILAVIIAAGTLIFSSGLLIGGLVLLPTVFFAPFSDLPSGGPFEAIILGLGSLAMIFAMANLCLGLSAAYGLYKRRPWGRVLAIIDSTISLISFPIGTILGGYGLWVLLPEDAAIYLNGEEEEGLQPA